MPVRKTLVLAINSLSLLCLSTAGGAANATPASSSSSSSSSSASPPPVTTSGAAKPVIVHALEREGVTSLQPFDTGIKDLQGFAGLAGQQPMAVYLLADGTGIVGTRIDADGKPLDIERVTKLIERPLGDTIWSKLAAAHWVQDGKKDAPRIVYTFSDPNCPYCNRFWETARPWVDSGKVQLRHVLVGVIKPDSVTKAAAILSAPDPSTALLQNERKFAQGGIKPARNVTETVAKKLQSNQMLMAELGFRGTPGIVYRNDTGIVERANGMPPSNSLTTILGEK
ncbi:thiol:disulfide interchange protein DsbG [Pandoraea anapnoica]|uniref:Thiol:disulfide interchange protein n=1 Tax=Pandoraea anapnoica TaxID=2508301 RepID=A0A5E5ANH7_9BURK|nr:thiol:disulfide interchange protein DsbG [Pandoraea anapnoica]VVE74606.1 thiol:disulfide interchange protein DsbG [Pandoraea anapnoica]